MAAIIATNLTKGSGVVTPTANTLTAADTLTYVAGSGQILHLSNPTVGSLTLTLLGNAAAAFSVDGYGSVSPTAGKAITVAAGAIAAVRLDDIAKYLTGTSVAATGAAGLVATLYSGTNA